MQPKIKSVHLTQDEKEVVEDMLSSGTIQPVLKLLEGYVILKEKAVVDFQYRPGEEKGLVSIKAEATGARKVYQALLDQLGLKKKK